MADSKMTPLEDLLPVDNDDFPQPPPPPPHYDPQPPAHAAAVYTPQHASQQPPPAAQSSMYQTVLEMLTSTIFLKAVLVAAAIVLAVMLFPVEDYVLKYAPFAEKLPHATAAIKALVAGLAITVMRPPKI